MISDRDTARIVGSWLEAGPAELPDRVLDAVLDRVPATRQRRRMPWSDAYSLRRRRPWLLVAAVLALVLVLVAGLLIGIGAPRLLSRPPQAFMGGQDALAGRYVIDRPFPIRIALDIPAGWSSYEFSPLLAEVGRGGVHMAFTFVDAIYEDFCHWDRGFVERIDPPAIDLAEALAFRPGLLIRGPDPTTVGGLPAWAVTITAPDSFEGCVQGPAPFRLWGVPGFHSLNPGEENRITVLDVGSRRLVINVTIPRGAGSGAVAELDAILASIRIGEHADDLPADAARPSPSPDVAAGFPILPARGPVVAGAYRLDLQLYRLDGAGERMIPFDDPHRVTLTVPAGWIGTGRGIAEDGDSTSATGLSLWSVASVSADPCRWRTSADAMGEATPPGSLDGVAGALHGWWVVDPSAPPVYQPPPSAPRVTDAVRTGWNGKWAWYIELEVPSALDPSTCDDGEYRVWSDHSGLVRTAAPGEIVRLWVIDVNPGIAVLDIATLPGATEPRVTEVLEVGNTVWIDPR